MTTEHDNNCRELDTMIERWLRKLESQGAEIGED